MSSKLKANSYWKVLIPGWGIWLVFLLGWLFPEPFWGVHALAFLPPALSVGLLGTSLVCLIFPLFKPQPGIALKTPWLSQNLQQWVVPSVLSIISILLFAGFSMDSHPYGDSYFLQQSVDYEAPKWGIKWVRDLFHFEPLNPKGGTLSVYALVNFISASLQVPGIRAFELMSIGSGGLFVFLWSFFVIRQIPGSGDRILLLLIGFSASIFLQFFGHLEVYGPSLALSTGFFLVASESFKNPRGLAWWLLIPVFLLNLKFHFTAYLLFPALLLAFLHPFAKDSEFIRKLFTWKGILLRFLVPLGVGAVLVFVVVTESVYGPRAYTEDTLTEVLFLPVVSTDGAPLDRYNLFSGYHFWDYLNMALLWSPLAIAILAGLLLGARKSVDWNKPAVIVAGVALISYLGAFFILNPLLGMAFDWDLYSLPAPALLAFTLLVIRNRKEKKFSLLPLGMGLSILAFAFILVHFSRPAFSERLESIGRWHFKTYNIGVSTAFEEAFELEDDPQMVLERRLQVITDLEPYAVPGNDIEYADLLMEEGKRHFYELNDRIRSLEYYQKAYYYCPYLAENIYELVINHFLLGQYKEALNYCPQVIELGYPDKRKAYRVSIHTAVMAKARPLVRSWCEGYLKGRPEDAFIRSVLDAANRNEDWATLEAMFASG